MQFIFSLFLSLSLTRTPAQPRIGIAADVVLCERSFQVRAEQRRRKRVEHVIVQEVREERERVRGGVGEMVGVGEVEEVEEGGGGGGGRVEENAAGVNVEEEGGVEEAEIRRRR